MKKQIIILLILVAAAACTGSAQGTADSSTASVVPETYPAFKNGLNGWVRFLEKNLDRNLLPRQNAPAGKYTVVASFMVETDGTVKDIRIETDKGYGTGEEVTRILRLTDRQWAPAREKGQAISFRHRQSITFVH